MFLTRITTMPSLLSQSMNPVSFQSHASGAHRRRGALPLWWRGLCALVVLVTHFLPMSHATEITGLSGSVTALAFSPDGKTLAAADSSYDLTLWEVSSGKLRTKLNGIGTETNRVCWSPDGKTIYGTASNHWSGWDTSSGKEKVKVEAKMARTVASTIALSPDGKTLAAAGNSLVKFWETGSGNPVAEYEVHPNYPSNWLAFSPDGKSVVTTSNDRTAQVTDVVTGAGATYTCGGRVSFAEFSVDGKTLFVVDQSPLLHSINLTTDQDTTIPELKRVPKQMAVSRDGRLVAFAGPSLLVWSIAEGTWAKKTLDDSVIGATAVTFSPDSQSVACGDAEGRIHLWRVQDLFSGK